MNNTLSMILGVLINDFINKLTKLKDSLVSSIYDHCPINNINVDIFYNFRPLMCSGRVPVS